MLVNLQGKLKSSRKQPAELVFDYTITAIGQLPFNTLRFLLLLKLTSCFRVSTVCTADSVLGFHRHGMQGRSFKDNEVVQEIKDETRSFKLLGSDRLVFSCHLFLRITVTSSCF